MAMGLKLKRKHGERIFLQPCPAYQESSCTVYTQRPERCQLFECRLLKRVASGEWSEAQASDKIREVLQRVARVNELIDEAGKTNLKKPLTQRYEKITAEPVGSFSDPETVELRSRLALAMEELEAQLQTDFRP